MLSKTAANDINYDIFYNKNPNLIIDKFQYEIILAQLKSNQWETKLITKPTAPYYLTGDQKLPSAPEFFYRCTHLKIPPSVEIILFKKHICFNGVHPPRYDFKGTMIFIQEQKYPGVHYLENATILSSTRNNP